MFKKYKYVYNQKTGHFIKKLNEYDSNVITDTQQQQKNNPNTTAATTDDKDTSTNNTSFKSI